MIQLPPRRAIKQQARRWMIHPLCLRVTIFFVCIQLALFGVRVLLGANLSYGLMDLNRYGDTTSGLFFYEEGFSLIFRMDLTQMVLAVPVSYAQLRLVIILGVVCFLILAPLRMGAMEQYWNIFRGGEAAVNRILRWITQPMRWVKSAVVEFILQGVVRFLGLIAMGPSIYCFYLFYKVTPTAASYNGTSTLLQAGGSLLLFLAVLFTFWLHCTFLPLRYCLAAHPEYSLGEVFRRGMASVKDVRGAFFGLRSSYLLWFLFSYLTYNAMDFFVLPYSSLGSMIFLQEAARAKQQAEAEPPVPPMPPQL